MAVEHLPDQPAVPFPSEAIAPEPLPGKLQLLVTWQQSMAILSIVGLLLNWALAPNLVVWWLGSVGLSLFAATGWYLSHGLRHQWHVAWFVSELYLASLSLAFSFAPFVLPDWHGSIDLFAWLLGLVNALMAKWLFDLRTELNKPASRWLLPVMFHLSLITLAAWLMMWQFSD